MGSCGHYFDVKSRFCPICGRPVEVSGEAENIYRLLRQVPFLENCSDPMPLSSGLGRKKYRVDQFGTPFVLHVVDCGATVETFNSGVLQLAVFGRAGAAVAVRQHLYQGQEGTFGFLLETEESFPTLEKHMQVSGMRVSEALDRMLVLSRILDRNWVQGTYLKLTPETVCVSPNGSFLLNTSCVALTGEERNRGIRSPFAPPEVGIPEGYPSSAVTWALAQLLYYILAGGVMTVRGGREVPCLPPHIYTPVLSAFLDQATAPDLRQRSVTDLKAFGDELERLRGQLSAAQLERRVDPQMGWFDAAPASIQASRAPAAPVPPVAPVAPRSAPAPAPAKSKKGGFLSGLFSSKKTTPPAPVRSVPPAPAPSRSVAPSCPAPPAPAPRPSCPAPSFAPPPPAPSFAPPPPPSPSCGAPSPYPITGSPMPSYSSAPPSPASYPITGSPMPPPGGAPGYPFAPVPQYSVESYIPASRHDAPAPAYVPPPRADRVQFSAVAPKETTVGDYAIIQLFMYEQEFRQVVDEALAMMDTPAQEKRSGFHNVKENTRVKVILTCPDMEIQDNVNEQVWCGGYLQFDFALCLPEDFRKKQVLLNAAIYFDDIPATRLMLMMKAGCTPEATVQVTRQDILSAFVSYASQDRARVAGLIQGMRKARPEMDIFFDVTTLQSGEDWEQTLFREIQRRDILFLCWSRNARNSPWVEQEWHYALEHKGIHAIEPIPLEPPDLCPPPAELSRKHFNDSLLYISR